MDTQVPEEVAFQALLTHLAQWPTLRDWASQTGQAQGAASLVKLIDQAHQQANGADEYEAWNCIGTLLDTAEAGIAHMQSSAQSDNDTAQTQLQDLQNQIQATHAEIHDLQTQNNLLIQDNQTAQNNITTLISNSNAGGSNNRHSVHRITKDPEPFDRTGGASRRQQDYKNWKVKITPAHMVDKDYFATEFQRILHVFSLLQSDPADRIRHDIEVIQSHPEDKSRWPFPTVSKLLESLDRVYISTNEAMEARTKFDNLFMGGRPWPEFLSDFDKFAKRAEKSDAEQVSALRLKVSSAMADASLHSYSHPGRDDISSWITLFNNIWEQIQEGAHLDKLRKNAYGRKDTNNILSQGYVSASASQAAAKEAVDEGDPMILDTLRPSREECVQKGLCFYCRKPGHNKFNCSEKQKNDTKFRQRGPAATGGNFRHNNLQSQPQRPLQNNKCIQFQNSQFRSQL